MIFSMCLTAHNEVCDFLKGWSYCSLYTEWPLLVKITYRHVKIPLNTHLPLSHLHTCTHTEAHSCSFFLTSGRYIHVIKAFAWSDSVEGTLCVDTPSLSFSLSPLKDYAART